MNENDLERINDKILDASTELGRLGTESIWSSGSQKNEANEEYNDWMKTYHLLSIADLLDHAKMIGQPAIRYYNDVFNTEKGDCYNIRQMANAAKIFNPILLAGKSDAEVVTSCWSVEVFWL